MILYPSINELIDLHNALIDKTGGLKGEINIGYFESALINIQNDSYYPSFIDKLTHLIHSGVKFHSFIDGNKRTTLHIALMFIALNCDLKENKQFIISLENIIVSLASGEIDKEELRDFIQANISLTPSEIIRFIKNS